MNNSISKKRITDLNDIVYGGKLPPQALDLEEAVIGAAMLEKDAPGKAMALITADTFYNESNKLVWEAISARYRRGEPIDILTITEELRKQGTIDLAGGAFYVTQLTNRVASAANIEFHSHILVQKHIQRQVINIAGEMGKRAFEDTTDAFELLDSSMAMLEAVTRLRGAKIETFASIANKTFDAMLEASVSTTDMLGLPSKIKELNEKTLGFAAPDFIILAASPGEGKTTFALGDAFHMAKQGIPVAFLSAEMGSTQLVWKIFSDLIEEEIKEIRRAKKISPEKWDFLSEFVKFKSEISLYIINVAGQNVNQCISLLRELKRKHGIKKAYVDYIQLIEGPPDVRFGTREEVVSFVSRRLKLACMMLEIPITGLSQVTRLEKGVKRLYKLSDLRESGGLEQNADGVIFIYHPWMHGVDKIKERVYIEGDVLLIIEKWRLGATGKVDVHFKGAFNRFTDVETLDSFQSKIPYTDYTEPTREKLATDPEEDLPF